MNNRPDTIVLVHGLWMTPRSWEHWVTHYEAQGHTVLTPEQHESHRARRLFRDPRNVDVWRVAGDDLVRGSTSSIKR